MKTCRVCSAEKPATGEFFPPRAERRDGLDTQCRDCRYAYSRNWRERNKARKAAYDKAYYETHIKTGPAIYLITNCSNGKVYVGSSILPEHRWYLHRRDLEAGKHHSIHLQRAWNHWGAEQFQFSVIEEVESEDLLIEREQHWLDHYQAACPAKGYNIVAVASKGGGGLPRSPESIERMRQKKLGCRHTAETKQKLSLAKRGERHWYAKLTDNQARHIYLAYLMGIASSETKARFGISAYGYYHIKSGRTYRHVTAPLKGVIPS